MRAAWFTYAITADKGNVTPPATVLGRISDAVGTDRTNYEPGGPSAHIPAVRRENNPAAAALRKTRLPPRGRKGPNGRIPYPVGTVPLGRTVTFEPVSDDVDLNVHPLIRHRS